MTTRRRSSPWFAATCTALALCAAALGQRSPAHDERFAALDAQQMQRTSGGATIDFSGDPAPMRSNVHQIPATARVQYGGSETVILESWVNGSKTGTIEAVSEATQIPWNDAWNYLRIPMPLPPAATSNLELRYSLNPDPGGFYQSYASYGGDATKTITWTPGMKVAGINFWNVRGEGMMASFPSSQILEMVDNMDAADWARTTDGIMTGRTNAKGSTNSDTINCWGGTGWNFALNRVRTLDLGDADCLEPWIARPGFTAQGPNPPCPDFKNKVTNALAAADSRYGDYVNVVVINGAVKWNAGTNRYEDAGVQGWHSAGTHWSTSAPTGVVSLDAMTIVHELGHEIGIINHKPANDPNCVAPILGNRPIMCDGGGMGVDKQFCDTIVNFTGIRNHNPSR